MTESPDPSVEQITLAMGEGTSLSHQLFGSHLNQVIIEACEGRLEDIHWFRTDWQRGGAMTGYGRYQTESDLVPVVMKFPVPPQERRWLKRLQPDQTGIDVVPRLYADGDELGGYDMAWVVMERLTHGPLDASWNGSELDLLVEAIGRFYLAVQQYEPIGQPKQEDWEQILKISRDNVRKHELPDSQRWNSTLKEVKKRLKKHLPKWQARDCSQCIHGDLHAGNAMTRTPPPNGPALLFDLAEARPGHWVEDAVNFERIYWSRPDRLGNRNVVKLIAAERKRHQLPVDADYHHLANTRRLMLAAAAPAFPASDHEPSHLRACLNQVEKMLTQLH